MSEDVIAAEGGMLIRRPVAEVFRALVDPEVTTKFWFTRSSGKLEAGKRVRWEWEMYDQSADVDVDVVEENERIVMRWPAYSGGGQTTVEWTLTPRGDNTTFITVTNTGFTGDQHSIVKQAIGATGGFTLVLAGMKAWLEHGIELNLIRDRFSRRTSSNSPGRTGRSAERRWKADDAARITAGTGRYANAHGTVTVAGGPVTRYTVKLID